MVQIITVSLTLLPLCWDEVGFSMVCRYYQGIYVWSDMRAYSCNRSQRSTIQGTTQHHLTPRCRLITANQSRLQPIVAKIPVSSVEGCIPRLYLLNRSSVASPPIPLKHPTPLFQSTTHVPNRTVHLDPRRQLCAILWFIQTLYSL